MGIVISSGGSASVPAGIVPTGGMIPYGGASPYPSGYVLCDGAAISRTTFADLFAVIGTQYGIGDGSTTFNVPDMKTGNEFPRGATNDAGRGNTGGSKTHTLTIAQTPAHTHGVPSGNSDSGTLANARFSTLIDNRITTTSVGSGNAHNNEPQFVDFNWIMKT